MNAHEIFALSPEQHKLAQEARGAIQVKDAKPLYRRPDGATELWGHAWPPVGDTLYESLKPVALQKLKDRNQKLAFYRRSNVMLVKGSVLRADNCASALVVRLEHAGANSTAVLLPSPGTATPSTMASEIAWPTASACIIPSGWSLKAVDSDLYMAIWTFLVE